MSFKSLNNLLPSVFNSLVFPQINWGMFYKLNVLQVLHQGNLIKFFHKTNKYGKYSITVSVVEFRNKIQKQLKNVLLKDLSPNKIKTSVSNFCLKPYC